MMTMGGWEGRYHWGNDGQMMSLALQKWCNKEIHSPALGLLMTGAQPLIMAVTSISLLVVTHSLS